MAGYRLKIVESPFSKPFECLGEEFETSFKVLATAPTIGEHMVNQPPSPLKAKVSPGHPFFDLIEEAYRVFDYPRPVSTEVCHCCMDEEIEVDFFNPPIRQLPLEYVRDWYFAAYDPQTGMAKATWAYLLPRLLEILATDEDLAGIGLEVSLRRFDTGNPKNWSTKEWAVLDRFQRMFLQHRIEHTKDFLDDAVCMFRLGGWPLDDLTNQLKAAPSATLAARLWNDWCAGCAPGRENIWVTAFWEGADSTEILDFYTSDALYEKMEALALDDNTDPELAAKASAVASMMRP